MNPWDGDWCGTRVPGRIPLPPQPSGNLLGLSAMPAFGSHIGLAGVGGGVIAVK